MKELKIGDKGSAVEEIQLALSGFGPVVWDGDYGLVTAVAVARFQRLWMRAEETGVCDLDTVNAIIDFNKKIVLDWDKLGCDCGVCHGFGQGQGKDLYLVGKPEIEAYYQYEYPGIHKAILWAAKAMMFHVPMAMVINSGYRCHENNAIHDRTSTNHMGKAIDMDVIDKPGSVADSEHCNTIRDVGVSEAGFQIGWNRENVKSFESSSIAPTWVHMDCRCFQPRFLDSRFFVMNGVILVNGIRQIQKMMRTNTPPAIFLDVGNQKEEKASPSPWSTEDKIPYVKTKLTFSNLLKRIMALLGLCLFACASTYSINRGMFASERAAVSFAKRYYDKDSCVVVGVDSASYIIKCK